MSVVEAPQVAEETAAEESTKNQLDQGWLVICWNDPVNMTHYVTRVFQKVFGWNKEKATRHMMEVHNNGKSVLVRETLEKAEHFVHELQKYSLHATMEKDRP